MAPARHRGRRALTPKQKAALAAGRRPPWQKGESGNPRGPRPGLAEFRELLEAAVQKRDKGARGTRLERTIERLSRKLAAGDHASLDLVLRRVWPMPFRIDAALAVVADPEAGFERLEAALADREAPQHDAGGAEAALSRELEGDP